MRYRYVDKAEDGAWRMRRLYGRNPAVEVLRQVKQYAGERSVPYDSECCIARYLESNTFRTAGLITNDGSLLRLVYPTGNLRRHLQGRCVHVEYEYSMVSAKR